MTQNLIDPFLPEQTKSRILAFVMQHLLKPKKTWSSRCDIKMLRAQRHNFYSTTHLVRSLRLGHGGGQFAFCICNAAAANPAALSHAYWSLSKSMPPRPAIFCLSRYDVFSKTIRLRNLHNLHPASPFRFRLHKTVIPPRLQSSFLLRFPIPAKLFEVSAA